MTILVLGLLLFLGVHLVPAITPARQTLYASLGEKRYKGMFSAVAGIGLVLIIVGFALAPPGPQLFEPWAGARRISPSVVMLSLVLFAAANMRGHLRARLRHPMLIGTILWSGVHLLANGELRSTLLFGGFLGWSVVDLVSAIARGAAPKPFTPVLKHDVIAILAGVVLGLLLATFHRVLFGVPVVPWSL